MTTPPANDGENAAERLNHYWDTFLRDRTVHPGGPPSSPGNGLEPDLAAAVSHLHARDDTPAPAPEFAARLWRRLVPPTAEPLPAPVAPVTRRAGHLPFLHPAAGRPLIELLAAALILALVGGSLGRSALFPHSTAASPTVSVQEAPRQLSPRDLDSLCLASPTPHAPRERSGRLHPSPHSSLDPSVATVAASGDRCT